MTESPIIRELAALADPAYQRFQSKLLRMASQPPHSFPRKRPHAQYGHGFIQHFATHGPPEPRTQIRQ